MLFVFNSAGGTTCIGSTQQLCVTGTESVKSPRPWTVSTGHTTVTIAMRNLHITAITSIRPDTFCTDSNCSIIVKADVSRPGRARMFFLTIVCVV